MSMKWNLKLIGFLLSRVFSRGCVPVFIAGVLALTCPADCPAGFGCGPRTYVVNQRHPQASDQGAGTESQPFSTICRAAELAQPGDTVLVHAGVYRERVSPARGGEFGKPITYLAAAGEEVFVKGSEVWQGKWEPVAGHKNVYKGMLDMKMFGDFNPYRVEVFRERDEATKIRWATRDKWVRPVKEGEKLHRTRGQLFVDGEPMNQVDTLEQLYAVPGTWIVSAEGDAIYANFKPTRSGKGPEERLVEITVRHRIFGPKKRGLGYIHVKGFIFEHAANNYPVPQIGAVSTRTGHHWLIEDCVIRYAKTIGLDVGSEWGIEGTDEADKLPQNHVCGYHIIRNNIISDNGLCGISGARHTATRIINNLIERNNRLGFRGWEMGAIKTHRYREGLIEGNLIRNNDCFGIWLDAGYTDTRITRNVIINSYLAGIFLELGKGPALVDNNIVAYTKYGDGIYTHDASGITIAHNLLYGNAHFGVWTCVATDRRESTVTSSNHELYNNMILGNKAGAVSFSFPWQRAKDNLSDYNLFMGAGQTMDESTGAEAPLFRYNTSHQRVKMETIADAFGKALNDANIPNSNRPNIGTWMENPNLSLQQWRLLSGNDRNSKVVKLKHDILSTRIPALELNLDGTLWQMKCKTVKGVTRDFFDNRMPWRGQILAGPFQNVQQGENRLVLWPVGGVNKD